MDDPESKTAFYNEIAKKLLGFTEELERTNYTQAVSRAVSYTHLELETIIQDMLEERCEDVTQTERDIKVVLTELGTPNELASKYKGETQDCLIGQPYYSLYVYVLKRCV